MDYEEKFLIGDYVKGKRTFNGEVIEGKFNGFHLYNKLNPKSVVGVIDTDGRCYDVSEDSIELVESEDDRIRKTLIKNFTNQHSSNFPTAEGFTREQILAWLEKQGEQKPSWSEEDKKMLNSIIEEIRPFGECPDYPTDEDREYYYSREKMIDWLMSIKPQNRWKPSEEQMQALFEAKLASINNREYFLGLLYEDLKKL